MIYFVRFVLHIHGLIIDCKTFQLFSVSNPTNMCEYPMRFHFVVPIAIEISYPNIFLSAVLFILVLELLI